LGLVLSAIAVVTLVLGRAGTGNLLAGLFGICLLTLGGAYFVRRARREAARARA
jgi:LPXTG-motif cell wall-anchored protein